MRSRPCHGSRKRPQKPRCSSSRTRELWEHELEKILIVFAIIALLTAANASEAANVWLFAPPQTGPITGLRR
jgi:hypothetical protein